MFNFHMDETWSWLFCSVSILFCFVLLSFDSKCKHARSVHVCVCIWVLRKKYVYFHIILQQMGLDRDWRWFRCTLSLCCVQMCQSFPRVFTHWNCSQFELLGAIIKVALNQWYIHAMCIRCLYHLHLLSLTHS